jgi:hypothetical protein
MCGFVCAACSLQMPLSSLKPSDSIIGSFKSGVQAVTITCPECGQAQDYSSSDLKVFLPGGKQIQMRM